MSRFARIDSILSAAHHVYAECKKADRIAGGLCFVPRSLSHPTIVNSHDPALAQLKSTIEYVNICRDTFAHEINGVETEENKHLPKKQCTVCYRDVPETSVFKHIGRCTFHACTRCWVELWSRFGNAAQCPQCRARLGPMLLNTFEGSYTWDVSDTEE